MINGSFALRLQALMRDGNLTGADLARWFDRPDATVRGWISGNHDVGGAPLDAAYIEAWLVKLEKLVKKKRRLPVPRMSPSKRIEYLQQLKLERQGETSGQRKNELD